MYPGNIRFCFYKKWLLWTPPPRKKWIQPSSTERRWNSPMHGPMDGWTGTATYTGDRIHGKIKVGVIKTADLSSVDFTYSTDCPSPGVCFTYSTNCPSPGVCFTYSTDCPSPAVCFTYSTDCPSPVVCFIYSTDCPSPGVCFTYSTDCPSPGVWFTYSTDCPSPVVCFTYSINCRHMSASLTALTAVRSLFHLQH